MNKNLKTIIKIIVGLTILIIIYIKIGPYEVFNNLLKISPNAILIILFLFLINTLVGALNIDILIRIISKKINYLKTLEYYLYSWSIGLFLPGKMGEFSLTYFLKRENIPPEKSIVIQLLDKVITLAILTIITLIGIFLLISKEIAVYALLAIIIIIVIAKLVSKPMTKFVKKLFKKHTERIKTAKETLLEIKNNRKKTVLINIILTILKIIILAFIVKAIFYDLNTNISILNIIIINSIVLLSGLIPISINGLGVRQALGVYLFSILAVPPTISLVMYTIMILLNYGLATLVCLKLLIKK